MTQKQTSVQIQGLITQPNALILPPGTLRVAENIQFTGENQIEPRSAFVKTMDFLGGSFAKTPGKLWPFEDRIYGVDLDHLFRIKGALNDYGKIDMSTDRGSGANRTDAVSFSPGKSQMTYARRRLIFTENIAPIVVDRPDSSTGSARTMGLGMPIIGKIDTVNGPTIPARHEVSYRAVFRKRLALEPEYTYQGPVSAAGIVMANTSFTATVTVHWNPDSVPLQVGDEVELYRTEAADFTDATDHVAGDVHRFAKSVILTQADINAGQISITDTTPEASLGDELYSNPSNPAGNPISNHFPPPYSTDVTTFQHFTFYVNPLEWQTFEVLIAGKLGELTTPEDQIAGIGQRIIPTGLTTAAGSTTATYDTTLTGGTPLPSGISIGQVVSNSTNPLNNTFPPGARIDNLVTVGTVTTFTFSQPAHTNHFSSGGGVYLLDTITINGVSHGISSLEDLMEEFGEANTAKLHSVVPVPDKAIAYGNFDRDAVPSSAYGTTFQFTIPNALPNTNPPFEPGSFTISASNGQNYSPPLTNTQRSSGDPRLNRISWSDEDVPESVGTGNSRLIGEKEILRIWPTKDQLFIFCTDGVFTLDGTGSPKDWTMRPYNLEIFLEYPDAIDSLDNNIFLITDKGFCTFSSDAGYTNLSEKTIGPDVQGLLQQLRNEFRAEAAAAGESFNAEFRVWGEYVACDKHLNEVWFCTQKDKVGEGNSLGAVYIWSVSTNTWTTQFDPNIQPRINDADPKSYRPTFYHPYYHSIIRAVKYIEGTNKPDSLIWYDDTDGIEGKGSFAPSRFIFHGLTFDDPGLIKQWIDVTVFKSGLFYKPPLSGGAREDWFASFWSNESIYPETAYPYDGLVHVPTGVFDNLVIMVPDYALDPEGTLDEWVVPIPRNAAHSKQLILGFRLPGGRRDEIAPWVIRGLSVRYRMASKVLRR